MGDLSASWSCTSCGASIPTDYPYTWCAACGVPLPSHVTDQLRNTYTGATASAPAPPDAGQWLATSQATLDEAYAALLNPPRLKSGSLVLVGTMAAFLAVQAVQEGNWWSAGLLVGVLLLHEAGHVAGMRWFGYQDVRMFFIPLVGAAVSGRPTSTAAWKDGVVTLLGPLPGIVIGLAVVVAFAASGAEAAWLWELAALLVMLNAFNLLPLGPLDGGRLFQSVLFSRHIALEMVAGGLAIVALVALGLVLRAGLLLLLAVWSFVALRARFRAASAVRWLRRAHPNLGGDPAALTAEQRFSLFTAARTIVPDKLIDHPPSLAAAMNTILESFRPRPSLVASVLLLGAWASGIAAAMLAIVALSVSAPAGWARYDCPDLGVSAEFPTAPTHVPTLQVDTPLGSRDARACLAEYRGTVYSLTQVMAQVHLDEAQRRIWLDTMSPAAHTTTDAEADGLPATDLVYESPEEGHHRLVFAGTMIFRLSAFGAGSPGDARRFVESFRRR